MRGGAEGLFLYISQNLVYFFLLELKVFNLMIIMNSTKGVGITEPDSSEFQKLDDGVIVPLGKPKEHSNRKVIYLLVIYIKCLISSVLSFSGKFALQ